MNVDVPGGKYVVAVSGGVDSVALLHMLVRQARDNPDQHFIVAHFDHGIRPDSAEDRKHVQQLAKDYGLKFVHHRAELGPRASEDVARRARYAFLHELRRVSGAHGIITAHHEDDVLETIVLNLLRGTGSRGLSALRSSDIVMRPLLHVSKRQLETYAKTHRLQWRQDATNDDTTYLRNYIRHNIIPRLGVTGRKQLLNIGKRAALLNAEIDSLAQLYLHTQPATYELNRHDFIQLPHLVALEVMASWLRTRTGIEVNKKLLERLVMSAKTGKSRSRFDVAKGYQLKLSKSSIELLSPVSRN